MVGEWWFWWSWLMRIKYFKYLIKRFNGHFKWLNWITIKIKLYPIKIQIEVLLQLERKLFQLELTSSIILSGNLPDLDLSIREGHGDFLIFTLIYLGDCRLITRDISLIWTLLCTRRLIYLQLENKHQCIILCTLLADYFPPNTSVTTQQCNYVEMV